jgi:copper chaperone CopZ
MRKLLIATVLASAIAFPAMAETIHVGVDGLVCAFCVKGIESSFKKQDAVKDVKVGLDEKLVTITTKEGKTMDDVTIKQIITDAGYTATTIHHQK